MDQTVLIKKRLLNNDMERRVLSVCEPAIADLGYDCIHLEFISAPKRSTLRVFIDSVEGVTVDDCARTSRHLDVLLDAEDVVAGPFNLEVSSPGLDRPIGRVSEFENLSGTLVQIVTWETRDGQRRWTGRVEGVEESQLLLEVDGEIVNIPLNSLKKANIKYEFDVQKITAQRS
jgi:ribosome maturation factor RimP